MKATILGTLICFFQFNQLFYSQVGFSLTPSGCSGNTYAVSATTGTGSVIGYTWSSLPTGPVFSMPNSPTSNITFPAAGSFTVSLAVQYTGTLATDEQTISIASTPTIIATQSAFTTCITHNAPSKLSKPVVINVSGAAYPYTWQPPQPSMTDPNGSQHTVRPGSTSCYTVSGGIAGCIDSAVFCVTVVPQFTVEVNQASGVRCVPDSLMLTATVPSSQNGPFSYSWTAGTAGTIQGGLTQSVKVFPTSLSTYSVEIKDGSGCISLPAVATVSVENCSGVAERGLSDNHLKIFPNPVSDRLSVISSPVHRASPLIIFNTFGEILFRSDLPLAKEIIDFSGFPKGIYFLMVEWPGQKPTKLIKQ